MIEGSLPQDVTKSRLHWLKIFGSLVGLDPFGRSKDGGPFWVTWYRYILNQMDDISGIAGPKCGGKLLAETSGRISFTKGA